MARSWASSQAWRWARMVTAISSPSAWCGKAPCGGPSVGSADRVVGGGDPVHALAHGPRRDLAVLAELGQGLRAVLVHRDEHLQAGIAEAAFGTFAAEAAIEPSRRGPNLSADTATTEGDVSPEVRGGVNSHLWLRAHAIVGVNEC